VAFVAIFARVNASLDFENRGKSERGTSMTEEQREHYWEGTPLQMWYGMDPNGIKEIVIEFDTGDEEFIKPRLREEFQAYELWEAANYLGSLSHQLG
jgi:hypothetical protein